MKQYEHTVFFFLTLALKIFMIRLIKVLDVLANLLKKKKKKKKINVSKLGMRH